MPAIKEFSVAQWFLRHRELSGFQNPSRSLYTALREAIENALTACELTKTAPVVKIAVEQVKDTQQYKVRIEDNGPGVDEQNLARAFGRFLTSGYYAYIQSLPYNTPVIVKKGEAAMVLPIGEFVEKHKVNDYQALSYAIESGKLEWQRITGGDVHPIEGEMYQITAEHGAKIRLTGNHQLLVIDKDSGALVYKQPEIMAPGDSVIAPRAPLWPSSGPLTDMEPSHVHPGDVIQRSLRSMGRDSNSRRGSPQGGRPGLMGGDCTFLRVESVKKARKEPLVYDLSVAKNNNFLAGEGAIVTHNSRSLFGVGIKATLLAAQATTGKPTVITSSTDGKTATKIALEIDVSKNEGKVLSKETIKATKTGLGIEFTIAGDYVRAKGKILEYLVQTTIVAPYVEIHYTGPGDDKFEFTPIVKELPKVPREMLPHPSGIDVETFKSMIHGSKHTTAHWFLKHRFQRISGNLAAQILDTAKVNPSARLSSLSTDQIAEIVHAMRNTKFMTPSSDGLSPVTSETLIAGLNHLFKPEWVDAVVRPPSSYSGYPFIVTAAIIYGGDLKPGIQLFRFANRIPLLFDEGNDVSRKVIDSIEWNRYKIDTSSDKIGIAVSIVSVKIPFKTAGKEYIADVDEVEGEIRLAIQRLGRGLMLHVSARHKVEAQAKRNEIYNKYIPQALGFISKTAGKPTPMVKKK